VGAAVGAVLACAVFVAQMSRPAVRNKVIAKRLRSKRRRSSAHEALLAENSIKLAVLQLQGVLFFGNANDIRLEIDSLPEAVETLILDFHDVTDIDLSGSLALSQACTGLRNQRRQVLFSSLRNPQVEPAIREMASDTEVFVDLDAALERFEEEILRRTPGATGSRLEMKLVDSDFGRQMTPEELSALTRHLQHVVFPSGAALCRAGDPSDRLWVLTRGCVSVWAPTESGPIRLESIGAGCMVGEMGLLDERPRSADVFADEEVHAYELTADAFRTVLSECPQLGQAVVKTIARELAERVRITSRELQHANQ
jgi:SulP family sulfate permease